MQKCLCAKVIPPAKVSSCKKNPTQLNQTCFITILLFLSKQFFYGIKCMYMY